MRNAIAFFLILSCFELFSAVRADASVEAINSRDSQFAYNQDRNSITGFVFGESRTPVPRINVELQTEFYSTIQRTLTNGSGQFYFNGIPSGRYLVKVMTAGTNYEEQSQFVSLVPISVIQGRGAVNEQIDFYLKISKRGREVLGAPGVLFAQDVPEPAKKLYSEGLADLEKKNEPAAYEKLKRSLEIFPNYYAALELLGTEYLNKGYFDAAFILLNKAVEVNPKSFSSTFGLGLAEFRLNRIPQAVERFRTAVRLDNESINAHLWLGIGLHSVSKLEEALQSLRTANKLSNESAAEVHWQLARVYKDLNRYAESAKELEQYLKYRPDAANAAEVKKIIQVLQAKK
jgi:tetratricopeptide (TPR) repeat protein